MFDFAQIQEVGKQVVEFVAMAKSALAAMQAELASIRAELAAHREEVRPALARVENIENAHREIFEWIADIENSEVVEAAAAIETAVVVAETSAHVAEAAADVAIAAAEETKVEEMPPAETPPMEETPIPAAAPEHKEPKRKLVSLF